MKSVARWIALAQLVMLAGCDWQEERVAGIEGDVVVLEGSATPPQSGVAGLQAWVELMTVDDDPTTDPGMPDEVGVQDPAYLWGLVWALCTAVEYFEGVIPGDQPEGDRPDELKRVCGPPTPDPVLPPKYPDE
jgi:hypothetical protein